MIKGMFRLFAGGVAAVTSLVFLAGCISDDPGSSSIAYVNITSPIADAIRTEVIRVFADDNYKLVGESAGRMEFEREATRRDQVMYGSYGQGPLVMRIVVSIEPRRQGGSLVRADAYAMNGGSETKVLRMARRPYMDLLNRVKANLVTAGGDQ